MNKELTTQEFIQLCDTDFEAGFRYYLGEDEADKIAGTVLEQWRHDELRDHLDFLKRQPRIDALDKQVLAMPEVQREAFFDGLMAHDLEYGLDVKRRILSKMQG